MIDAYKGREGLVTYCVSGNDKKWIQNWANNTNELYGYKEQYGNTLNNYISMAIYNAKQRTPLHVKEMVWLFIDIDCKLKPLTLEENRELATAILEREDMPEPTLIEFSGHGLQMFYKLKNATDIPLWKLYQNAIVEKFKRVLDEIQEHTLTELSNLIELSGMHIDALKDPSRVMRVPDTVNIKYDEVVMAEILHESKATYTLSELKKYDVFSELVTCTPYNALSITEKDLKAMGKQELGNTLKGTNEQLKYFLETRIYTRLEDLETLIKIRNKNGVNTGYRNSLIAIYLTTLVNLGYKRNEIINEITRVNESFKEPLTKTELKQWIKASVGTQKKSSNDEYKTLHRTYYKYTTKRIMEKLNITEEEQEGLKIFISRRIRNKRDYQKNGTKYKAKRRKKYAQATESKRISKEERNKQIVELSKQGLSTRAIAEQVDLNHSTVVRILKNV